MEKEQAAFEMKTEILFQPKHFSWHQDFALALYVAKFPKCPLNCAKNGAANCDHHVQGGKCEPARQTAEAAEKVSREMRMANEARGAVVL